MVTGLPNDTVGAIASSDVGAVKRGYNDPTNTATKDSVAQALALAGLDFSIDDILAALGDSVVVSLGNVPNNVTEPLIGLRTHTPEPGVAQHVVSQLNKTFTDQGSATHLVTRDAHGDLVVADSPSYADKLLSTGQLGDQKRFKNAVGPLSGTVTTLGYLDLKRILSAQPDHGGVARALTAVGFSVIDSGSDVALRVRLLAG
jgi:hypothetical protein